MFEESNSRSMEETCEIGTDKFKTSSTSKDSKRGGNKESNDEMEEDFDEAPSEVGRKHFMVLTGAKEVRA